MGRGCRSRRVCSTPLFSLIPAIAALFSSSRSAQPAAHVQAPGIFRFLILHHLFLSVSTPCNLSPPDHFALLSPLRYGLPSLNVSVVVGCHAARRHFGLLAKTGETFLQLGGTLLAADRPLPCFHDLFLSLSHHPSSTPPSLLQDSRL